MKIRFRSTQFISGILLVRKQVSTNCIHLRSLTSYYVTNINMTDEKFIRAKLKGIELLGLKK